MTRKIPARTNKDYWGFYQVGPYKTYSKLDAVEISGRTKNPIQWNYNNELYSSIDWTVEPVGSLDYWYKVRAEQLREAYDYLVLAYSGGADSHNMLMTFVSNNIFVDEIVQFHSMEGTNEDKTDNANIEQFKISAPFTKHLIETNPVYKNTKHSLVDITKFETKSILSRDLKWDWWYDTNVLYNPALKAYSEIRKINPEYQRLTDQGKKVCFVWGLEKPRVQVLPDYAFYATLYEVGGLGYLSPKEQQENNPGRFDEAFYWAADLPELMCKQCHTIKKFLINVNDSIVDNVNVTAKNVVDVDYSNPYKNTNKIVKQNKVYTLEDEGLNKLIYPHRAADAIHIKPSSMLFGSKDEWLWHPSAPDVGQKHFYQGIFWFKKVVMASRPDLWYESKPASGISRFNAGVLPEIVQYKI